MDTKEGLAELVEAARERIGGKCWYTLRQRITKTSEGTGIDDLDMKPVDLERIHVINHISFENKTSATPIVRFGLALERQMIPFEEQRLLSANTLYWTNGSYVLMQGDVLRLRFTGAVSGDKLEAYIFGHWIKR